MRYLLLFLLLPLARPAAAQTPALPKPPHTVVVRGAAWQELEPEKADLLLTYRFSDNVKDNERTLDQERALQKVLSEARIAPDKLTLDELSATGYGGSKTINSNVALTKVYRLTLENPQMLNDLIPKLVLTGADNLRVVNRVSSRLEATKLDVAGRAAANAHEKAQLVVKQAGGQLGGVLTMTELVPIGTSSEALFEMRQDAYKSKANYASSGEGAEIGTPSLRKIRVEATYDVVFEIK
jgi:uncharacterized protein YggE